MTPDALTALLERLERAGASLEFFPSVGAGSSWRLNFQDGSYHLLGHQRLLNSEPLLESARAVLLGWAVQEIEASGYVREVELGPASNRYAGVLVYEPHDDEPTRFRTADTELEATLISLAEILERKDD